MMRGRGLFLSVALPLLIVGLVAAVAVAASPQLAYENVDLSGVTIARFVNDNGTTSLNLGGSSIGGGPGFGSNATWSIASDGSSTAADGTFSGDVTVAGTLGVTGATTLGDMLSLRNSTTAQEFRIYETYTDGSNYEYYSLAAGSNALTISAVTAGTGADNLDLKFTPAGTGDVEVTLGDFIIPATSKIRLDGSASGNTYIYESTADIVKVYAGGQEAVAFFSTGIGLPGAKYFYWDGGFDTSTRESSADVLDTTVGGVRALRITESTTITSQFSDALAVSNTAEGNTGMATWQTAHDTHTLAAAATSTTADLDIPSGSLVFGCQTNNDVAVSDDGGDDTWSANLDGGAATALVAGAAAAQNTKVDAFVVPVVVNAETNVKFTANGGSFDGGVIEITCLYFGFTSMADAS